jgi:hypothetical protein
MVYDIEDYWVFGLCPSSGILKTQKNTTFRKLDLSPSSGQRTSFRNVVFFCVFRIPDDGQSPKTQ